MTSLATVDSSARPIRRARDPFEWYVEPEWAVRGLLSVQRFPGPCWDPACGIGTIPHVFRSSGQTCFGTDILWRDHGDPAWWIGEYDFTQLGTPARLPGTWQSIVTNPPFSLAEEFLQLALARSQHKVAMLLRLSWIEGVKRRWVWDETPISAVHPFARRVSMPPGGAEDVEAKGGAVAFAWFIWDLGKPRGVPPIIRRIEIGPDDE